MGKNLLHVLVTEINRQKHCWMDELKNMQPIFNPAIAI